MRRREFITLISSAAVWPLVARAQQRMPVIGFLGGGSPKTMADSLIAFHRGLGEIGYTESQNVAVVYRWAEGRNDRLPELAADLVRLQVAVIVTAGASPAALAARSATTSIPIVFQIGIDPVQAGLVASLNRPGGNVTGFTSLNTALEAKRLEVLHKLIPTATRLVELINPSNTVNLERRMAAAQAAGHALGLEVKTLSARSESEFDSVFASAIQMRAGALAIAPDPLFQNRSDDLAAKAVRYAVPTISPYRSFATAGGLMSYGNDVMDQYRKVGVYAGRILKGEKPGDLPVEQAAKIELVVNLRSAKALGITVPIALSARADALIE